VVSLSYETAKSDSNSRDTSLANLLIASIDRLVLETTLRGIGRVEGSTSFNGGNA
jgi:hypothetical protein